MLRNVQQAKAQLIEGHVSIQRMDVGVSGDVTRLRKVELYANKERLMGVNMEESSARDPL